MLKCYDYAEQVLLLLVREVMDLFSLERQAKYDGYLYQPTCLSHNLCAWWGWLNNRTCDVQSGEISENFEADGDDVRVDLEWFYSFNILADSSPLGTLRVVYLVWRSRTNRGPDSYRQYIRKELFCYIFGSYPVDKNHLQRVRDGKKSSLSV